MVRILASDVSFCIRLDASALASVHWSMVCYPTISGVDIWVNSVIEQCAGMPSSENTLDFMV